MLLLDTVPYHLVSAATTNATSVKSKPGKVAGAIVCLNLSAAPRYLKFYDKATAPTVGTDTPVYVVPIPGGAAGGQTALSPAMAGLRFLNGIAIAITAGMADSDATAIGASEVVISFGYTSEY